MHLTVSEQGSVVRVRAGRICVERQDIPLKDFPAEQVEEITLVGGVQPTSGLMRHMLGRSRPIHLLAQSGRYLGQIGKPESGNVELLKAQVRTADNAAFVIQTARAIVQGKLENARVVLNRLDRGRRVPVIEQALSLHTELLAGLQTTQVLDEIRGFEGAAAHSYFAALVEVMPAEWNFTGRNKRPPRDPINALLSFGYTLLAARMIGAVQQMGLHPAIGTLHVSHGTRPALALDLMEEFRAALVDRLALTIVSRRWLAPSDFSAGKSNFSASEDGVYLNPEARGKFLRLFSSRLEEKGTTISYKQLFMRQARAYAAHVLGTEVYRPLRIR